MRLRCEVCRERRIDEGGVRWWGWRPAHHGCVLAHELVIVNLEHATIELVPVKMSEIILSCMENEQRTH